MGGVVAVVATIGDFLAAGDAVGAIAAGAGAADEQALLRLVQWLLVTLLRLV